MKKSYRKTLLIAGKCVLAAALLAWALRGKDSATMWQDVLDANWVLLGAGALAMLAGTTICAYRLQILLEVQEIRVGLREITRLTFLGQFFNNVIPGSVGGDLVKAYYLGKHTTHKARVLLAIFVDRVLGLAAMVLMAAAMVVAYLWARLGTWHDIRDAAITVMVLIGAIVLTITFILSPSFRRLFRLQKIYGRLSFAHHFSAAAEGAGRLRQHPRDVLRAVVVTLISQTFWIGSIWLLGVALHIQAMSWYHYFLYVPLIYVIGAVPVTPGGLGVIEKAYQAFLGQGIKGLEGVALKLAQTHNRLVTTLALLARFIQVVWSLPGLLFALQGAKVPKAEAIEAELGLEDTPAQA